MTRAYSDEHLQRRCAYSDVALTGRYAYSDKRLQRRARTATSAKSDEKETIR